jgi:hypothetical protein
MAVTTVTTSLPHSLKRGDVLTTNLGGLMIVRSSSVYAFTASPPRWYERLRWWWAVKCAEFRAWLTWKLAERRIRKRVN